MIKNDYCVYLLKSETSNKTYIGYTVDIARRIRAHNGLISGGAAKTRLFRPWSIVLYVSGFPYERTAMQYEFCIHHTKKYKRTSGIANKMKIMKALLKQERICSTAIPNSDFKRIIFFSNQKYLDMWNSI